MYVFFFNDTATTEIYTLSLHDALRSQGGTARPLRRARRGDSRGSRREAAGVAERDLRLGRVEPEDRKSTRLNSSHANISYAVFCLKKKKKKKVARQSCHTE